MRNAAFSPSGLRAILASLLGLFVLGLCAAPATRAEEAGKPFLHTLFTDHMVLQRGARIPVWGWTEPGATVHVSLGGNTASAVAGPDGKWMARLPAMTAGGPYEVTVSGPKEVTVHDVLIGDVWICSGQSNMEMGIKQVDNAAEEVSKANYPRIRLFTVPHHISYHRVDTVPSQWLVCTPETVSDKGWGGFSAVGYFFGRDLQRDLKVPIGLIHSSWGGTVAEAWASGEKLSELPDFADAVKEVRRLDVDETPEQFRQRIEAWWRESDPGSREGSGWADPAASAADWKPMNLPTYWENAGLPGYDGVVWFRKEFVLPADWSGKDLTLHLGPVDDDDTTYVNGAVVGAMNGFMAPRNYKVPSALLRPGTNLIAVRVLDTGGEGGLYGKPDQMSIEPAGGSTNAISLAGEWRYNPSAPLGGLKPYPQTVGQNPNVASVLYNGMIAPLEPFAIRGAIWYQGESNVGRAAQYKYLLPAMIEDWRARFGVGQFPFLIVGLANFMAEHPQPGDSAWAELREAQVVAALRAGNSGVASAIDIGDARDIHPKNKQEVGRRLSLIARAKTFSEPITFSGPVFRSAAIQGRKIVASFENTVGLTTPGGAPLRGFAIAGSDKKFVWADAVIEGKTVVLSSPSVERPVYIRYDWADNPAGNLYNDAALPAVPFRTDAP